MTTYAESVAFIHHLPRLAKSSGHERIKALLAALGNPEKGQRYVHVTGTNGKGSTASAIAHILEASGLTAALFTSPFIMRFNERFMIDHRPIPDDDLVAATTVVHKALKQLQADQPKFAVTEFEFITALAFWYFHAQKVDVAVIEVGIGGLTDSTNVLTPVVSVITSVGLDHQKLLGNTITSVATHKAGIIKAGKPVVTAALPADAMAVVKAQVAKTNSAWLAYGRDFGTKQEKLAGWGQSFTYFDEDGKMPELQLPLVGPYQLSNAAVAIKAAKVYAQATDWPLRTSEIRRGLARSTWPGRMEKISDDPLIVLDGAHNPQGIKALVSALDQVFHAQPMTLIAGVLKDKDVTQIVDLLAKTHHRLFLVPVPDNPRASQLTDYPAARGVQDFSSWQEALAAHMANYADEPLVITGSLYLVAAVRQTLLGGEEA